jgi:hypothetical protein
VERRMGFHMIKIEEIYEIYRHYLDGKSKSEIGRQSGLDRKTVREYIRIFESYDLSLNDNKLGFSEFVLKLEGKLPAREKRKGKMEELRAVKNTVVELFENDRDLRVETVYRIVKAKVGIGSSYGTFRRFVLGEGLFKPMPREMLRIELPAGEEIQIDYAKMGTLFDPLSGSRKTVYAFIGILSYSRLPYVEFVYTQNEKSFTESFIRMFEYYRGVPKYVSIDNLKSGVIKADLYEPVLNKSFSEMTHHYDVSVNTCRVRTPTDKGKVERFVQVVREQFKYLTNLYADDTIAQLNVKILDWCKKEYGQRKHGTTGEKPLERFELTERFSLKPLPENPFTVSSWKEAKVHPDQFIQFEKKRYSLPSEYRGKIVTVQKKGDFISIFYDHRLIKQYRIPAGIKAYDKNHFPEVKRDVMDGSYTAYLLKEAGGYGNVVSDYIQYVLSPNAYINARRAKGCLAVIEEYRHAQYLNYVCGLAKRKKIVNPKYLKQMMEDEKLQGLLFEEIPRSAEGDSMLRSSDYYTN